MRGARSLFLLGDLFEAWIGDDDPEPAHRDVIAAIAAVAASGTLVYVMRGNRDFMLGERFCREAGAILLDDPAILTLHGERLVLSHGDGLCIDDRAYQRLRALVRDDILRAGFARLPIDARRRLASEARAGSREHLANAASYITDVNPAAVEALFRDTDAALMIHGHTHRPGRAPPRLRQRRSHAYRARRLARRSKRRPVGRFRLAAHAVPGVVDSLARPSKRAPSRYRSLSSRSSSRAASSRLSAVA